MVFWFASLLVKPDNQQTRQLDYYVKKSSDKRRLQFIDQKEP